MFIAHLPVGYLSASALPPSLRSRAAFYFAMAGSLFPDIDLLYFYLPLEWGGGGRQVHHHTYWPHTPAVWVLLGVLLIPVLLCVQKKRLAFLSLVFFGNVFMHLGLDTLVGHIRWFWPLDATMYALVEVPARYPWWVMNFILHWTFLLELALLGAAVWVFRGKRCAHTIHGGGRSYKGRERS